MENVQTKVCPRCGRDLPLSDYSKGSGKFGRRSICKECDRLIHNTPESRERRRLRRLEREKQFDSPTIDKLIPSLGYTKGNVWVISRRANMIKSDATLEELELLVGNLKTHWIH